MKAIDQVLEAIEAKKAMQRPNHGKFKKSKSISTKEIFYVY